MSITLYFAKLNLISEDLFQLYDDPKTKKAISFALYEAIHADVKWEKENIFVDDHGDPHSTVVEYTINIIRADNSATYFEGWLYKKSKLYYKVLDENTNKLVQRYADNTEGIRFTIDIAHGYVGYNTSSRFGYKEFIDAFKALVNNGEAARGYDFRYSMSICTSGINLEEIKDELSKIGNIKELRIRMQPPNPSDDILEELQKRCDGVVKDFKDANVTGLELFYSTSGTSGINLSAPFVKDKIDDIQGLYSALPVEESTKNGYVSVEATSTAGRKYSSEESRPLRRVVLDIEELFDSCIDAFQHLF